MRLYIPKQERDKLLAFLNLQQAILKDESLSSDLRQEAEDQMAIISGMLLSPLFPAGFLRNALMIGFCALGVLAFLTPYEWLFWSFFIGLTFSPRIVGEMAVRLGAWFGRN